MAGAGYAPLLTSWKTSPPTQQSLLGLTFTARGGQTQSSFSLSCHCTALSPWGAESSPYPWPVPPVTLHVSGHWKLPYKTVPSPQAGGSITPLALSAFSKLPQDFCPRLHVFR